MRVFFSNLFTANVKPHFKPFKASVFYQTCTAGHSPVYRLTLSSFPLGWLSEKKRKKKQLQFRRKSRSFTRNPLHHTGLMGGGDRIGSDGQGRDFHSCSCGRSAVIPPAVQTVTPLIRGCHGVNGREATLRKVLRSSSISRSVPCRVLEMGA